MPERQTDMALPLERVRTHLEQEIGLDTRYVDFERISHTLRARPELDLDFETLCQRVAAMIAVHETYFLRHQSHYQWIEQHWLKQVIARKKPGSWIRILSAGCSTGEEPYSLYAHLVEPVRAAGLKLFIDAVDLNEKSLAIARQGKYGLWSLRGVDCARESHWLDVRSRSVYVKPAFRENIAFTAHNLMKPLSRGYRYDLILCRNVLIYMNAHAVDAIYTHLLNVLDDKGVILPGPSDPAPKMTELAARWHQGVRVMVPASQPAIPNAQVEPFLTLTEDSLRHKMTHKAAEEVCAPRSAKSPEEQGGVATTQPAVRAVQADASLQKESEGIRLEKRAKGKTYEEIESLLRAGEYEMARNVLDQRIQHDRFDVRAYLMLAVLGLDLDDIELASRMIRKSVFIEPESPYPAFISADVKARLGDKKGALADLQWVKKKLASLHDDEHIRYCEEITAGQLKQVVEARLSAV